LPFQNVTTLIFIACLLVADVMAYMLNIYPASGLLWALNLNFANFFHPLLSVIDDYLSMGLAGNLLLYGLIAVLPVWSLFLKNRLSSAIYCHLSLAALVVLTFAYGPNRILEVEVADRSGAVLATLLPTANWEGLFIIAVAIALAVACVHAHISMLRSAISETRSRRSMSPSS
jgi:hypothetical protein